jgi:hypothetical protein
MPQQEGSRDVKDGGARARERPAEADGRPDERERAAAYLDLWERHLSLTSAHAPGPEAGTPRAT